MGKSWGTMTVSVDVDLDVVVDGLEDSELLAIAKDRGLIAGRFSVDINTQIQDAFLALESGADVANDMHALRQVIFPKWESVDECRAAYNKVMAAKIDALVAS